MAPDATHRSLILGRALSPSRISKMHRENAERIWPWTPDAAPECFRTAVKPDPKTRYSTLRRPS